MLWWDGHCRNTCTMHVSTGEKDISYRWHEQTQIVSLKRDESDLITRKEEWLTIFDIGDHPKCLINIFTGMHASKDEQKSLLSALDADETQVVCRQCSVNRRMKNEYLQYITEVFFENLFWDAKKTPFRTHTVQTLLCMRTLNSYFAELLHYPSIVRTSPFRKSWSMPT